MANEISYRADDTGLTAYFTVRSEARTMWNGSTLEALTVANWATYDVALAETPASSYFYVGTWPAALTTAGWYYVDVYEQAGVNPAISDTLLATLFGYWDGTTFCLGGADSRQVDGSATPAQKLKSMFTGEGHYDGDDPVTITLAQLHLKANSSTAFPLYVQNGDGTACSLEGDGGGYGLAIVGDSDAALFVNGQSLANSAAIFRNGGQQLAIATEYADVEFTTAKVDFSAGADSDLDIRQSWRDAMKRAPTTGDPDAGSIDLELDTIAIDVAGLDGAAMRGTDGAYTGTPPTADAIGTDAASKILATPANKLATDTSGYVTPTAASKTGYALSESGVTAVAAGVWAATTRTLTSFGALAASVALAVWAYTARTLTGSSSTTAPSAYTTDADIHYSIFKNGTHALHARVKNNSATDIVQADITSIAYTVYLLDDQNPDTRTAVTGHSAVTVAKADVIFDTLQTDDAATNYNFRHTPPISTNQAFTTAGRNYLVEYTITPISGQKIIARFRVACI